MKEWMTEWMNSLMTEWLNKPRSFEDSDSPVLPHPHSSAFQFPRARCVERIWPRWCSSSAYLSAFPVAASAPLSSPSSASPTPRRLLLKTCQKSFRCFTICLAFGICSIAPLYLSYFLSDFLFLFTVSPSFSLSIFILSLLFRCLHE